MKYISRTRPRIFSIAKSGRRRRYRGRPTNLARCWLSLNSLGATRSWNVLWKLLWKALRAMDWTGAPSSLLLHTCCHGDEPPWNPAGSYSHPPPLFIFPSSRGFATSRVFSIDPRKCLVFHHHHIHRRYLVSRSIASFSLFSFSFFPYLLLGYISWLVFSLTEIFLNIEG